MVRKILDAAALLALLVSTSLAGGSFFLYKYVTSPDFKKQVTDKIMKEVTSSISLPSLSGPALPTGALSPAQQKNEEKKAFGLPKF
tara:strand:- start:407 stop:664 length:258 start_codon:yes stop_codon:yes gene_type:complete